MNIHDLADSVNGRLLGCDEFYSTGDFTGRFTLLNDSSAGDIVIRHWINAKGVEIAAGKKIACLITQNPKDGAIETAVNLNFPLIVTDRIELANAYALKWTINKYSSDSTNIIVTGTNGKSTTSHLIHHILSSAGFNVFTNTDSESEFNTLIDPMVCKLISDSVNGGASFDYLVIEVSEVQGWLDKLMKNHAALMADAVNPDVAVITNIAMDHIGLVNSIEDVFDELSKVPVVVDDGVCVLNFDDNLVRKLNSDNSFYWSMNDYGVDLYFDEGIFYNGSKIIGSDELPFTSNHFIQNILAAIGACISLGIDLNSIKEGVKSYKALSRRFTKLHDNPLIIDDFAHNPDGIKNTIRESIKLLKANQTLFVVCSIRGSRGVEINELNVNALVDALNDNCRLVLSSSNEVVDDLNFVTDDEKNVFFRVLNENNVDFIHFDNLNDCLVETYNQANDDDVILLIGAQGMDPAKFLLSKFL